MKSRKGFTLIELLVVIAIIALLLAIIMPSLRIAKEHAKRLICATHMKSIGQAIVLYAEQQNDELPMNFYQQIPSYSVASLPGSFNPPNFATTSLANRRDAITPMATYFLGRYDASVDNSSASDRLASMLGREANGDERVTNLGYLVSTGLLEDVAEVAYCTSNKTELYSYNAYGGKANWPKGISDTPNPHSIRVSFSYLPQARVKKHPNPAMSAFPDAAYKMSELNPNLSMVLDLLNGDDMSHKMGGYIGTNILYGGGYVVFKKDEDNVIKDGGNLIAMDRAVEWRAAIKSLE